MQHHHLLLAMTLAISCSAAEAGFHVGNGGDLVECRGGTVRNGLFALDSLVTEGLLPQTRLMPVASLEASFDRIEAILTAKAPGLRESFREFRATLWNTGDYSQRRVWEEAPFGLIDLEDENLVAALPPECRSEGKARLVQAVVRQDPVFTGARSGKIVYKFVPVVREIAATRPLEASFLLVHEWLWDHSGNVDRNRRVNRFLHSALADEATPSEFQTLLSEFGLVIPKPSPDIFQRDACGGPSLTRNEWNARLRGGGSLVLLGEVELAARRKVCMSNQNPCPERWLDAGSSFYPEVRHVAAAHGEVAPGREAFLAILNRPHFRLNRARLTCTVKGSENLSLECGPLFPLSGEGMPDEALRFVSTGFTTHCLRLEASSRLTGPDYASEMQVVLFARLQPPFAP